MGTRGPIPKRSAERLGHRHAKKEADPRQIVSTSEVKIPPASPRWCLIARRMYNSLRGKEISLYMVNSDWAAAYDAAETLTLAYKTKSAELFKIADRKWDRLLLTEASRRRSGIEIERPVDTQTPETEAGTDHRARLTAVS